MNKAACLKIGDFSAVRQYAVADTIEGVTDVHVIGPLMYKDRANHARRLALGIG